MSGHARPWDLKPRQRKLTPLLRRQVEPAGNSGQTCSSGADRIGREHTHTHWKTNPYDSNPFLFSAKRRDQGGHKEVPYTCCPYLGLACSANANAISLAAFTTSLSSKRPKRPGLV